MESLKTNIQKMLDEEKQKGNELAEKNKSISEMLKTCEGDKAKLEREIQALNKQKEETQNRLADLDATCKQLNENYNQLKSQNTKQMRELIDELEAAQTKLTAAETRLEETRKNLEQREARLTEVEQSLKERDQIMNNLKKIIGEKLFGFRDKGFSVEIRDGKVYVSLSNQLLFASGSTLIDKKGQEALRELALVLKEQQDITIMVEGHTDNVKVTNLGQIKDNWDLSVMRSTEVIRILIQEGVDRLKILASGRGENMPIEISDTPEARAKNRRTEIIISPQLDELYNMLKN